MEKSVNDMFEGIIANVPVFMRDIARKKVSQRIERIVKDANRSEVTEKDLVDAFFIETPFGFHGPLKTDMQKLGIDYTKYGYEQ
ncbi:MAG: DUF2621 family protein [Candidatus Omnitrophica bacterium]|nr:DUF2621 family protein [Candidatus Omnitrophota bacterium]MDE2010045.1 DUF2621 family protein [Candidatus Omnitrophota bacterium]MDE2214720.1 DUF2621 family protein [Candidatus Omnitrophota bacterium]MDE2231797.1 DUF2621 family protein [Candidatus Omnitrophota bacterium]